MRRVGRWGLARRTERYLAVRKHIEAGAGKRFFRKSLHASKGSTLESSAPRVISGHAGETDFSKWIFAEWHGAYDLRALGEAVDILCLMTYDQSTRWTTPGPVGGWDWTNKNLEYALQVCTFTEAFARYRGLWIPLVHRRSGREQKGQGVQRDRGLHLPAHRRLCPRPAYVVSSHRSRSGRAPGL